MSNPISIVWFRRDLRLDDNPAWNTALRAGLPILPIYLHCPDEEGKWRRGGASNWWLHHALDDLYEQLSALGYSLLIRQSTDSQSALERILDEVEVAQVFWNRVYETTAVNRDTQIKAELKLQSVEVSTFNGNLLFDPLEVANKSGKPFRVFTPFWKHCCTLDIKSPRTCAQDVGSKSIEVQSLEVSELGLLPSIPWDKGMQDFWEPTRAGGLSLLKHAISKAANYQATSDTLSTDGTSRLSSYLHFGQISPAEFYAEVLTHSPAKEAAHTGILRQLFWREFSAHLLFHFPYTHDQPLRPEYETFPWDYDSELLSKWQKGETGFPLIDAGMRQLWHTGWMHNRVRMVASSFLVKHLLQPWQEGAHWFWDTLVDADLPNNTMGWQWVGGCGADASRLLSSRSQRKRSTIKQLNT